MSGGAYRSPLDGDSLPSGTYVVRMQADGKTETYRETVRMTIVR